MPYEAELELREPGALKGQISMAENWDSEQVNREIEGLFHGSKIEPGP